MKKKPKNSKYANKFKERVKAANTIGSKAFYINNKGRKVPLPDPLMV